MGFTAVGMVSCSLESRRWTSVRWLMLQKQASPRPPSRRPCCGPPADPFACWCCGGPPCASSKQLVHTGPDKMLDQHMSGVHAAGVSMPGYCCLCVPSKML